MSGCTAITPQPLVAQILLYATGAECGQHTETIWYAGGFILADGTWLAGGGDA